ncbi:MAG: hypothetical protein IPF44_12575 [Betaproteobacteria bacterium]|nr:hypothetical protein [Betaproteobacteria bacterium]MBP6188311.1 hypothetical protein [Azonexus sp.]MBP6202600.1 hypothetical protein [Azonexus sp.]
MQENRLTIDPAEFKAALKPFVRKGVKLGRVMVAFDGGFLSIESGDVPRVMRTLGTRQGWGMFKLGVLRALLTPR